jgi:YegS/Rv2252/BmrU family lipid kinase
VRAAVIFNPTAKGDKARTFRESLDTIAKHCTLKRTQTPGDATRLAAEAINEGHDTLIAAGGDGTLNEVLNGLAQTPGGLEKTRLGVLPLGTVNVFARELGLPTHPPAAWPVLLAAAERQIDLPYAEWTSSGQLQRRYFVQLAGAGLDSRAIELTSWSLKKKLGPIAYIVAGLKALAGTPANLQARTATQSASGQLVLIGNGRLYGGSFRVFPQADLADGQLDICVFPKVNWFTLIRCGTSLLIRQVVPEKCVVRLRAPSVALTAENPTRFEVEGELAEQLPVTFSVLPKALRVLVPR